MTAQLVRDAVIRLRDNRKEAKEMGRKGREEIEKNWTWDRFYPDWRMFFREALKNAERNKI
jgi:glycosyltransferase involved in cell wall biosynthesis